MTLVENLISHIELLGIFAFSASGALVARKKDFDLVGFIIVSLVTSLAGGVIRDLLIGRDPVALTTPEYLLFSLLATSIIFLWNPPPWSLKWPLISVDTLGVSVFAISSTSLGISHGLGFAASSALGLITGFGGGLIRDMLVKEDSELLEKNTPLYLSPAFAGCILLNILLRNNAPFLISEVVCILFIFSCRMVCLRYNISAPGPLGRFEK